MTQFDFGNLESPTSGEELVNTYVEPWRDALHSLHKGSSQPSYAVVGMMWIQDNQTPWTLRIFDGSSNISLGTIDPVTHAFSPIGISSAMLAVTMAASIAAGRTALSVYAKAETYSTTEADALLALKAALVSPTFTGVPLAPTAAAGTNNTQLATTAFTKTAIDNAKVDTALTGVPTAPTAGVGTNNTQIATTAFVLANSASAIELETAIADLNGLGLNGDFDVDFTTNAAYEIYFYTTGAKELAIDVSTNGGSSFSLGISLSGGVKDDGKTVHSGRFVLTQYNSTGGAFANGVLLNHFSASLVYNTTQAWIPGGTINKVRLRSISGFGFNFTGGSVKILPIKR